MTEEISKLRTGLIFDFIVEYKATHDGCSPSVIELRNAAGLASNSGVRHHIKKLVKEGKIHEAPLAQHRSIEVIGGKWKFTHPYK